MNDEVQLFLERAREDWLFAENIYRTPHPQRAASPAYHAMFHVAEALLQSIGIETKSHAATKAGNDPSGPRVRRSRRALPAISPSINPSASLRYTSSFGRSSVKKYGKFAALIVIIVGTLVWLAFSGMKGNQTYYKTISELGQMGDTAYTQRLRVAGDVKPGSIQRKGNLVHFTLTQEKQTLQVAYDGIDPLPDTFKDGAQALADGKMERDGVFHARAIQAKCASKYEAKPGQRPGAKPVSTTKASF